MDPRRSEDLNARNATPGNSRHSERGRGISNYFGAEKSRDVSTSLDTIQKKRGARPFQLFATAPSALGVSLRPVVMVADPAPAGITGSCRG
jgi:hypothetical protein